MSKIIICVLLVLLSILATTVAVRGNSLFLWLTAFILSAACAFTAGKLLEERGDDYDD